MYLTYDFDYKTNLGERVQVEVSYEYNAPDPYCVDSDWDYHGGFFLDVISITKDGKPWAGVITKEELQQELLCRLREDEIENVMYENEGF